jgi:hypothetical protein
MVKRPSKHILGVLVAVLLASGAVLVAQGPPKGYAVPKTPWGDPDLQGKWPGTDLVGVPTQRDPKFGTRNILTDAEFEQRKAAADRTDAEALEDFDFETAKGVPGQVGSPTSPPPHWLERGKPQRIASLIVDPPDGRIPPTVPGAPRAGANTGQCGGRGSVNSYTDCSLYDRCITRGVAGSMLPVIYNNGNEIVQAPGLVVLRNEMIHETRVVYLDGRPHPDPAIKLWMGDSRGHWEGDTLVVETTNFDPRTSGVGANGGGRISADLKITERLTRVSPDLLVWRMTFDDPQVWTRPFTIELPLKRDDSYGMFEYACHEGNYAMRNILSGARAEERK